MKVKIFDVIELLNGKKAIVRKINQFSYDIEIIQNVNSYKLIEIKEKDIKNIVYSNRD